MRISVALAIAPFIPSGPGVSTRFAPSSASTRRRSRDIVSGIVNVILYPRAAATNARAIPVLPLVGSTISIPGFSTPRFSASQIIAAPMRHFTEYAGFLPSILANTVALAPSVTRFNLIRGVFPILKELSAYTFAMMNLCRLNLLYREQPLKYKPHLRG
jgi:hypothetical protein